MNPSHEAPDDAVNDLAAMAARAVFLAYLGAVAAAPVLLLLTFCSGHLLTLGASMLAAALAGFCRMWLQAQGRFDRAKGQFDGWPGDGGPESAEAEHRTQFIELLRAWDELEQKRGSPAFDPWAAQAVRQAIRETIAGDPALERLFHT